LPFLKKKKRERERRKKKKLRFPLLERTSRFLIVPEQVAPAIPRTKGRGVGEEEAEEGEERAS